MSRQQPEERVLVAYMGNEEEQDQLASTRPQVLDSFVLCDPKTGKRKGPCSQGRKCSMDNSGAYKL